MSLFIKFKVWFLLCGFSELQVVHFIEIVCIKFIVLRSGSSQGSSSCKPFVERKRVHLLTKIVITKLLGIYLFQWSWNIFWKCFINHVYVLFGGYGYCARIIHFREVIIQVLPKNIKRKNEDIDRMRPQLCWSLYHLSCSMVLLLMIGNLAYRLH